MARYLNILKSYQQQGGLELVYNPDGDFRVTFGRFSLKAQKEKI